MSTKTNNLVPMLVRVEKTEDVEKRFTMRVVDGELMFSTNNISVMELNMYLDQAKQYLLSGGFNRD